MKKTKQLFKNPKHLLLFIAFAGFEAIVIQILMDMDFFAFVIVLGALTSVVESRSRMDEREAQLMDQAFSTAFQWSFAVLYIVFSFVVLLGWLPFLQMPIAFLNYHWLGITASLMCLLLGIAGTRIYEEV